MSHISDLYNATTGAPQDPGFKYIKDVVNRYTTQILFRIRDMNRFVKRDHILYKLISALQLQSWENDDMLLYTVREKLPRIATMMNMTYHNSYGKLHDSAIIPGTKEAIVLCVRNDNKVITILNHNHYNLNWELGNPTFNDGLAFIEINMYALARAYYKWTFLKEESIYSFIYKHILISILPQYMDIALYNRHMLNSEGVILPKDVRVTEYKTPNIQDRIDSHVDKLAKLIKTRRLNISSTLEGIPLFNNINALDIFPVYPSFITNQSKWVYSLAKVPFLYTTIEMATKNGNPSINKTYIGTLNRYVKAFRLGRYLERLDQQDRLRLNVLIDRLDVSLSQY